MDSVDSIKREKDEEGEEDVGTEKEKKEEEEEEGEEEFAGPAIPVHNVTIKEEGSHEHNQGMGDENQSVKRERKGEDSSLDEPLVKRRKMEIEMERLHLENIPSSSLYEISWMHREPIVHVLFVPLVDFLITGSVDGVVKFWKKQSDASIEFVKAFKSHLGAIVDVSCTPSGRVLGTVGDDATLKIFDVVTFDMVNVIDLGFLPSSVCLYEDNEGEGTFALVADAQSFKVHRFDVYSSGSYEKKPLQFQSEDEATQDANDKEEKLEENSIRSLESYKIHHDAVLFMRFHVKSQQVLSVDRSGQMEIWNAKTGKCVSKLDFPDLFEFQKTKSYPLSLEFSNEKQDLFASHGSDHFIRVFRFRDGKMIAKYDENPPIYTQLQESGDEQFVLDSIDFHRRLALESEIQYDPPRLAPHVVIDRSQKYALYTCMLGIKIVEIMSGQVVRIIGKYERNAHRFISIALSQSAIRRKGKYEPVLVALSYDKARFFVFSNEEPSDEDMETRDMMNEQPRPEETAILSGTGDHQGFARLPEGAVLHTSLGDIRVQLFPEYAPKAVENFTTHGKNGYYNNVIFHRVIRGFMIQTGDPLGDGTGGTSIWGDSFEDEFHRKLRHDRPYTLSMANAGPNTNGSQFFITVSPQAHLDQKHTIFGRVVDGMSVVKKIERTPTDKYDRPKEEIQILSISVIEEMQSNEK
eukprot:TRINITY_DN368_c4_g1_i1.p1 TRINITY_DN368_c4_g1~~TRINITY_DN368_c4_g1_i1.p1  ORF type:complete len:692 (+),score=228.01 TRINITY_DN368_c4_g1_i1:105-2180(+)